MRQQALTLLVPIALGQEQPTDAWLRAHKRALQRALDMSSSTHFARFVLLPPSRDEAGAAIGDRHLLALETNFDGELLDHVADLRAALGELLDGAFTHGEGYPGSADLERLAAFVRERSCRTAAFYVAHMGLPVAVVRGDFALGQAVSAHLREMSIGARVQSEGTLPLALLVQERARRVAVERGLWLGPLERGLPRAAPGALATALTRPLSVLAAFLLAPAFELRDFFVRRRAPSFDTPELRQQRDAIGLEEDRVDQNGLTHLVPIKPGAYRLFALKLMLWLATALAVAGAAVGRLGQLDTIHFARWVILPDRRLLFFSNYDGSWEAYLGDFIDKAAAGLTMIWTHTLWFPSTRLLVFRGATDEEAFKLWTRAFQVPTQVWYSAYPKLSVADVLRNARLRELLGSKLTEATARELLALV